jgi:type VI protein secretion system component VasF
MAAAATYSADAARSADAAGRAVEAHRNLGELRARMPRRFALWVPVVLVVVLALGYLWGLRPQGDATLAEPLQLRLERSLVTYQP